MSNGVGPSEQLRSSAKALAENLSYVIRLREERDAAEMMVGKLQGLLTGAEVEFKVRARAYDDGKALMAPQAEVHIRLMEEEVAAQRER